MSSRVCGPWWHVPLPKGPVRYSQKAKSQNKTKRQISFYFLVLTDVGFPTKSLLWPDLQGDVCQASPGTRSLKLCG